MKTYSKVFYKTNKDVGKKSAEEIMPIIIKKLKPKSIIDFGCGGGGWLAAINEIDPQIEILGLDGDWVVAENRLIDDIYFKVANLTQVIDLGKKYDLAISLEVAEHLDEKYADVFIDNICRHSDIVMFSAAIPLMGGTHHVNEQWPSYWIKKFEERGFCVIDVIRPLFWENKKIIGAYKQDTLIYVRKEKYDAVCDLFRTELKIHQYDIVHPDKYIEAKAPDKLINRMWMMKHMPEWMFSLVKKIYLFFRPDRVV